MTERFKLHAILFASVAFCGVMTVARVYLFGSWSKIFLLWNLFLAIIPFGISVLLGWLDKSAAKTSVFVFYPLAALWLLFFPNAPYVLTDLIHLRPVGIPIWYELFILLTFAWTSLMFGFVSLFNMQQLVVQRFNATAGWLFVNAALLLGSFGIYLGRFLRWNSWDVLTEPEQLAWDVIEPLVNPLEHIGTYGFTLSLTVFLLLAYLMLHYFKPRASLQK